MSTVQKTQSKAKPATKPQANSAKEKGLQGAGKKGSWAEQLALEGCSASTPEVELESNNKINELGFCGES